MSEKQKIQRPPYVTVLLCSALLLCFAGSLYVGEAKQQRALQQYLSSGLFIQETPLYLDYQSRQHRVQQSVNADSLALVRQHLSGQNAPDYAWLVMQDRSFVRYLEQQGSLLMQDHQLNAWRQARESFNDSYLSMIWPERFGLIPEQAAPATFITHIFLSPHTGALLLTLLMLCLIGPVIESRLGSAALTIWFIACGASYALLYSLAAGTDSPILLGPSGAVSGLSGVLIAIIMLSEQSIKTKAATSFLIAVLLSAKLLLELWLNPAGVTVLLYHAATVILCGATFVLLFSNARSATPQAKTNQHQLPAIRQGLNEVFTLLERFDFVGAKARIQELKEDYPNNIQITKQAFLIAKLQPDSNSFKADLDAYILAIALHDDYYCAKTLLAELISLNRSEPIDSDKIPSLIHFFATHNDLKKAEHSFKLYETIEQKKSLINEAKTFLYKEFEKRNLHTKMAQYRV